MKRASWLPSGNILGTVSTLFASVAFCAMLSYMIVSTHESLRMDLHISLSRLEDQLQSMQTSLETQQQLLFMHASDTRIQLAMRHDDMSVLSDEIPDVSDNESL